ncbi:MAG: PHP domain-containing protein [Spirochaetes bacterium]|jgi:hypothetical protein|nr:PHP domain-containing protein [Spirochaetota bacterium]
MKKIDLHTHTTASDGIKSPRDLIDFAIESGVSVLAITDHDTVDGLPDAMEYSKKIGFKLIPGIEFSIDMPGSSFHLVGLNIDYGNQRLLNSIRRLADLRDTRASRIVDDLNGHGIRITYEEVLKTADGGSIGRPHVARVLVKHGYGKNIREIFENYLVDGKPGYVKKDKISFIDAISLIRESGGISVVAHPTSLNFSDYKQFDSMLANLVGGGVQGMEVYAAMHTEENIEIFNDFADKYHLLVSGGSDYHGDKDEKIGCYIEGKPILSEMCGKLLEKTGMI